MESFLGIDKSAYAKFHKTMFPSGNIRMDDVFIKKEELVKSVIEQKATTVTVGEHGLEYAPPEVCTKPQQPPQVSRKEKRSIDRSNKKSAKRLSQNTKKFIESYEERQKLEAVRLEVRKEMGKCS